MTASPLSLTDKNLFSYCDNNPVARSDYDGEFWHLAIGAVVGAAVGAIGGAVSSIVSQAISGEEINWKAVGISAASGAVCGAITAVCPCMSPVLTGVVQGTISAATYAATEKIAYGRDPSLKDVIQVGINSGFIAGEIQQIGQELGFIQCFIAGTPVSTKAGLVPIEDIKQGDLVWASDPETGETALKEVVQLFRNETDEWVHVTVNGEEITSTPNHPFYSPVKGWTKACNLRAGDILVTVNGEYVVVEKVQHELLENPETTYNFEVEGFHTYYVGDTEVLVHNSCKHKTSSWRKQKSDYWKANQKTISDLYDLSDSNIDLMSEGKAPIGFDGNRIELHHVDGISNSTEIIPMTKAYYMV